MFAMFRFGRRLWFLVSAIVFGVVLLQMGARKRSQSALHAAIKVPTSITCAEFVKKSPSDGWFRISGCTTDAIEATFVSSKDSEHSASEPRVISEVAIPVRESPDAEGAARLVVLTRDQTLCSVVSDLDGLSAFGDIKDQDESSSKDTDSQKRTEKSLDPATKSKIRDYAKKNASKIFLTRTIEGMVRTSDDLGEDEKTMLKGDSDYVLAAHVILEEGATPATEGSGTGEMVGGILAFLFAGLIAFSMIARLIGGAQNRTRR